MLIKPFSFGDSEMVAKPLLLQFALFSQYFVRPRKMIFNVVKLRLKSFCLSSSSWLKSSKFRLKAVLQSSQLFFFEREGLAEAKRGSGELGAFCIKKIEANKRQKIHAKRNAKNSSVNWRYREAMIRINLFLKT
ncbi:MAG: hypothetical protein LiPW39_123 [Parcubacteria group bacterium LiPW_39]|nr:MAG: hypothetical protein LiPW39_123 [Parcubacteria group bacterium LiPW_39]